jgi:protein O-GlcNAc transferase
LNTTRRRRSRSRLRGRRLLVLLLLLLLLAVSSAAAAEASCWASVEHITSVAHKEPERAARLVMALSGGECVCADRCPGKVLELVDTLKSRGVELGSVVAAYEHVLELAHRDGCPLDTVLTALNQLGLARAARGQPVEALRAYDAALGLWRDYPVALINSGALYHTHMNLEPAVARYERVIKLEPRGSALRGMALQNLGVALTELGASARAVAAFERVLWERSRPEDLDEVQVRAQIASARRVGNDWSGFYAASEWLRAAVDAQLDSSLAPTLLPFDSLLMPLDGAFRLRLAVAYAATFVPAESPAATRAALAAPRRRPQLSRGPLRVGYLSHDFNDHPTAHLVEELFAQHERPSGGRVESHTLSYGKDDGSDFRRRIERAGHAFHDLVLASHDESVALIRRADVEVLVDLQGFTRGGRVELSRARPAPIGVNFLVFPGTSGAPWVDYFVGDRFASPPAELARHFKERLVVMPHCYQVNGFANYAAALAGKAARESSSRSPFDAFGEGARPGDFAFANLNKSDKLDPASFQTWMRVLLRVPGSVLWLLEPPSRGDTAAAAAAAPSEQLANLRAAAQAQGVAPHRLIFLKRVPKAEHLLRHARAGLFLDTFIYGAHSTATDALRGGLPVLTLAGGEFANRVAASLLRNVGLDVLVASDVHEFEEVAVRVATSPALAAALKQRLREARLEKAPLYDLARYTRHLEAAFRAMAELRFIWGEPPANASPHVTRANRHILVAP